MFRLALFITFTVAALGQRIVTTVAGTDSLFAADNRPALSAPLGNLSGLAVDSSNNIYATDPENHIVVRIDPNGTLKVVAGNGIFGYSGDGGPATSASINIYPLAVAVDRAGTIYLSDGIRVRKITSDGIISTIAGGGKGAAAEGSVAREVALGLLQGIAVDFNGNVLFSEVTANRIWKLGTDGILHVFAGTGAESLSGDGGPATKAALNSPAGVTVDPKGNVLIADSGNNCIRRVTPDGVITTILGGGRNSDPFKTPAANVRLVGPDSAVVDAAGNLYVFETGFGLLIKVTPDGLASSISNYDTVPFGGDGGPSTAATLSGNFYNANTVTVDSSGTVYVSDGDHGRIRTIDSNGIISTFAGNGTFQFGGDGGPASSALIHSPFSGVFLPSGDFLFTDSLNYRLRAVSPDGTIRTYGGIGVRSSILGNEGDKLTDVAFLAADALAVAPDGTLYIADLERIDKISPDGTVLYVANADNEPGFTGESGDARRAQFDRIFGMAFDKAGNLYFSDRNNHRIRKVAPDGTYTTFAGSGPVGDGKGSFSGDGGPATSATLNEPGVMTFDNAGNLVFVDTANFRVRKISPAGIITTLAGTGKQGFSGDGGPAVSADLNTFIIGGIVAAPDGSIYFADTHRVRRIAPDGTISTFAGTGKVAFAGDGGPPEQANFNLITGLAFDKAGNLFIADNGNQRIRVVLASPPALGDIPANFTFTGLSGGDIASPQSFTLATAVPGMAFTTTITTAGGGDWLTLNAAAGATPRLLQITANPFKLDPGTYTGTITIQVPGAAPAQRTINVKLTVGPGVPPAIRIDKQNLSFAFPTGGAPRTQPITVYNTGGGTLNLNVDTLTTTGGNWLSANPTTATAIPGTPAVISITADPTGLAAGTYNGAVTINGTAIPVTITVSASAQVLLLSQSGLSFTAVAGGSVVPAQSFGVLNSGRGLMPWTAETSTITGGDWLHVSRAQGATDASANSVPTLDVAVDATGLDPGGYYGIVRINAPASANRSQVITVFLEVLANDQDPGPRVEPTELVFTAQAGGGDPGSRDLSVFNIAAGLKSYHAVAAGENGAPFFVNLPSDATLALDRPTRLVVQPSIAGLAPGLYRGSISLQFTDGRARNVPIKLIVSDGAPSGIAGVKNRAAGGCAPTKLVPTINSLGDSFSISAGWPVAIVAEVRDDCGNTLESGSVRISFSNGDPPLSMQSLKNGQWHQTWQTGRTIGSQVNLTLDAATTDQQMKGTRTISGGLRSLQDPPLVDPAGITSAANTISFVPLAPGALISINGDRLSEGQDKAGDPPLPITLADTQAYIGSRQMPLVMASPGSLTAQVPFDIETNTRHQILIQRGTTLSQPVPVDVAETQPAIFSASQADGVVTILCSGLGAVKGTIAAGDPSPTPALAVVKPVQLTIGGTSVPVDSATLVPGAVGLYEIKAKFSGPIDNQPIVVTE